MHFTIVEPGCHLASERLKYPSPIRISGP